MLIPEPPVIEVLMLVQYEELIARETEKASPG